MHFFVELIKASNDDDNAQCQLFFCSLTAVQHTSIYRMAEIKV